MASERPYIPQQIREQVAHESRHRCGYCLTSSLFTAKRLHIDHIIALSAGGSSSVDNLWLACDLCNSHKGSKTHATDPLTNQSVRLFNPRQQNWVVHFQWNSDSTHIIGLTPIGRATVTALKLNHSFLVEARRFWIVAGWHPPED